MNEYVNEFERRYHKAKEHGCVLSPSILGFFLLNQCQLSDDHKKLIKATITELEFNQIKTKLLKVFGTSERSLNVGMDEASVKIEDVNLVKDEETYYGNYSRRGFRGAQTNSRYFRGNYANNARGGKSVSRNVNSFGSYRGGSINDRNKKTRCSSYIQT